MNIRISLTQSHASTTALYTYRFYNASRANYSLAHRLQFQVLANETAALPAIVQSRDVAHYFAISPHSQVHLYHFIASRRLARRHITDALTVAISLARRPRFGASLGECHYSRAASIEARISNEFDFGYLLHGA
jgi:hypothetical protein